MRGAKFSTICTVLVALAVVFQTLAVDVLKQLSTTKLNVHIVPHSHDDPGWLKTADQYYSGSNSSIYTASVQQIFHSVVSELFHHPERTYSLCEVSFFQRWWHEQPLSTREMVKKLFENGQLSFLNGGWVMHDEASSHYVSMIDQTALGHRFLVEELGYRPRVGWQIDPFGHSKTHAWLSSEVGFDGLFFGRIDYQDRTKRFSEKAMEFIWYGLSADPSVEVFTGAFSDGNYGPPQEFCLDTTCPYCRNDPVVEDPLLSTYNLDYKIDKLLAGIAQEASITRGNHIMLKMGADFVYANSQSWYRSLDLVIRIINARDDLPYHLFYSDPTSYMQAKAQESQVEWPTKTDDFFPYSDASHTFWTGYFTSRPQFKYLERQASQFLQVLKQVSAAASRGAESATSAIASLTAAVGLVNHHDSITGTAKQHVADDYKKILDKAFTQAEQAAARFVPQPAAQTCRLMTNESICAASSALKAGDALDVTVYNPLPREAPQTLVSVLLYEVAADSAVQVLVRQGRRWLQAELLPTQAPTLQGRDPSAVPPAPYKLVFLAEHVAPLSFASFSVHFVDARVALLPADSKPAARLQAEELTLPGADFSVSSDQLTLSFDGATGLMTSLRRADVDALVSLTPRLLFYRAFGLGSPGYKPLTDTRDNHLRNLRPAEEVLRDGASTQTSGAYIFRPRTPEEAAEEVCAAEEDASFVRALPCGVGLAGVTVVRGALVSEVQQRWASWASLTLSVVRGETAVRADYALDSLPVRDLQGKEVVLRLDSDLHTAEGDAPALSTDSNGRVFLRRLFNQRPTWTLDVYEPVAGNFYPLTQAMYLRDEQRGLQLSWLSDRSLGGASLRSGQSELMLQRRLLHDDYKGVEEALDETVGGISPYPDWRRMGPGIAVCGGVQWQLAPSAEGQAMRELRGAMDAAFWAPQTFLNTVINSNSTTEARDVNDGRKTLAALPENVQLVTLETQSLGKQLLVRLGHAYDEGEHPTLSAPVSLDLAQVFAAWRPQSCVELTLSANQQKQEQLRGKIDWSAAARSQRLARLQHMQREAGDSGCGLQLSNMQVRTFLLDLAA